MLMVLQLKVILLISEKLWKSFPDFIGGLTNYVSYKDFELSLLSLLSLVLAFIMLVVDSNQLLVTGLIIKQEIS